MIKNFFRKNDIFSYHSFNIPSLTLTPDLLSIYIDRFWTDVFAKIPNFSKKHLFIMVQVSFSGGLNSVRTLANARSVDFVDKKVFKKFISENLNLHTESYRTSPITHITFTYRVIDGNVKTENKISVNIPTPKTDSHIISRSNLPLTMDPLAFGELISKTEYNGFTRFVLSNIDQTIVIDSYNNGETNKCKFLGSSLFTWVDKKEGEGFTRLINDRNKFNYTNGKEIASKTVRCAPFSLKSKSIHLDEKILTFDLESTTISKNGERETIPYLISLSNGKESKSTYLSHKIDGSAGQDQAIKNMFNIFMRNLFLETSSSSGFNVFAHNFSGFDGILILKYLSDFGSVDPLVHHGKLMSVKLTIPKGRKIEFIDGTSKIFKESHIIYFKDSFLFLPASLRALCKAFSVINAKGFFPYLLNDIFYNGILPKIEFWSGISLADYQEITNKFLNRNWNFKLEAIKYCELDCKALHEILTQYSKLIFDKWGVNITKCVSCASLAMLIYNTNYMPRPDYGKDNKGKIDKSIILNEDEIIFKLDRKTDVFIRKSFTGGAVDVYIPWFKKY